MSWTLQELYNTLVDVLLTFHRNRYESIEGRKPLYIFKTNTEETTYASDDIQGNKVVCVLRRVDPMYQYSIDFPHIPDSPDNDESFDTTIRLNVKEKYLRISCNHSFFPINHPVVLQDIPKEFLNFLNMSLSSKRTYFEDYLQPCLFKLLEEKRNLLAIGMKKGIHPFLKLPYDISKQIDLHQNTDIEGITDIRDKKIHLWTG